MNRKLLSTVLSFMLVLTLLACATQPVLAEAPPPPGDEGAAPAAASSPAIPDEKEAEPEKEAPAVEAGTPAEVSAPAAAIDRSQWAPPPMVDTGGVGQASMAAFISDSQMLDAGGVLRAQGETLALGGGPAAIACPPGKVPVIYGGLSNTGCTVYYDLATYVNPIQSAHNDAKTTTGWWIWVTGNYLNPATSTLLGKSVVVKGDPLGTTVTGAIAMNYPSITLRELVVQNGRIISTGQSGTLRLQGVSVTGTFANQYGIEIIGHRGSIALTNVTSTIATGKGAYLDARGGTGTVTVLNSAFNNNPNGHGLTILAKNAVKVENVSAAGNGKIPSSGSGLYIEYRTRLTLKNIYAYDNYDWGIYAQDTLPYPATGGPVTLANITASASDWMEGIRLVNPGPVSGSNLTLNANATDDGIEITTARGSVSLSGVTAVNNLWKGIYITSNAGTVTISNGRFSGNQTGGVSIFSKSTVTVKNAILYNNNGDGVDINNSTAASPLGVTLTNLNVAQNAHHGIWVNSKGTPSLSGIASNANGYAGAYLVTSGGGTTVSSSYGTNTFNNNGTSTFCVNTPDQTCSGLYIDAKNTVSVSGATADNNRFNGIHILNASSARVTDSTADGNNAYGLNVTNKGSVAIDRVTAKHNVWGISLDNTGAAGAPSITLSRVVADYNTWGLNTNSRGSVTSNHISASNNTWGMLVTSLGSTTLNHTRVDYNTWGAFITPRGLATLNHISVSHNAVTGIAIDNSLGTAGVTLTNSLGSDMISHNGDNNLNIVTRGAVSIRGLNASGSLNGYGAWIVNTGSASSAGVSISSSDFNGNGNDGGDFGLRVLSKGVISLNTVTASDNKGTGADLQNQTATLTGKTVSVSKGTFSNNSGGYGVQILSKSTVTLNNVAANGNQISGVNIDNYQGGAGTGNVYILSTLGRNQFNNNRERGAVITTSGSVTVNYTQVDYNGRLTGSNGFRIDIFGATKRPVTFTCVSSTNNGAYGIGLYSANVSVLTLRGVWLAGNPAGGLYTEGTPTIVTLTAACP